MPTLVGFLGPLRENIVARVTTSVMPYPAEIVLVIHACLGITALILMCIIFSLITVYMYINVTQLQIPGFSPWPEKETFFSFASSCLMTCPDKGAPPQLARFMLDRSYSSTIGSLDRNMAIGGTIDSTVI